MSTYDVIIIGGGASGLTAALFTSRRGLKTLVLSQDIGGQASTTATIENYPGFEVIDGLELMTKFQRQAEKYGAEVRIDEAIRLQKSDDGFTVTSAAATWGATTVILAHGLTHKHLDVPGEEKFIGHGISFCASCDAPLYRAKKVVVIGGGNSAMDAALLLANFSADVTLVTQHAEFRGERILIDRLSTAPNIRVITQGMTKEILGDEKITGVVIEHEQQTETIPAEGVFVCIGFTINPKLMKDITELDDRQQIIVDAQTNGTSIPGLFAAGDVTTIPQKQVVISAGEGAKAGLSVYQYLQSIGKVPISGRVDWGVSTPLRHEKM